MQSDQNDQIVIALRHAARQLTLRRSMRDLEETLHEIVASAVATVPGIDAGTVSLAEHGRIETRQPTSAAIAKLDEAQSELGEGPCVTAVEDPPESGVVIACDFADEPDSRLWPRFAPLAVDAGFRSLISTQLATDGFGMRAALNLYSVEANAFDEHTRTMAGLFGVQAALLLYGNEQAGNLQKAVESRDRIGQAKGILMERFKVDAETAFQMMVKSSQDTNMKLTAVADWLTSGITAV